MVSLQLPQFVLQDINRNYSIRANQNLQYLLVCSMAKAVNSGTTLPAQLQAKKKEI